MSYGHIKVSRKLFDGGDLFWDERRTFSRFEAWVDLIQRAAWHDVPYSTKRGLDLLHRGEFVASLRYLSRRWNWGKNVVDRYFKACEKAGRIVGQRPGQHGRVYLIVNYDHYQSKNAVDGTVVGTVNGTATGQSRDKDESSKASKAVTTRASRRAVRAPVSAKPDAMEASRQNWVTRFADEFARYRGGIAPYRKVGKQLKPLIDRDGEEAIWPAWQRFCASDKAQYGAAWFAENAGDFGESLSAKRYEADGTEIASGALSRAEAEAQLLQDRGRSRQLTGAPS